METESMTIIVYGHVVHQVRLSPNHALNVQNRQKHNSTLLIHHYCSETIIHCTGCDIHYGGRHVVE